MKRKTKLGILTLILIGIITILTLDFLAWSDENMRNLNDVELVQEFNRQLNRLSSEYCSIERITELEGLIDIAQALMNRDADGEANFYSNIQALHGKLAYLYSETGNSELEYLNYELAVDYGNRMTPGYFDIDRIKQLNSESLTGCIIQRQ